MYTIDPELRDYTRSDAKLSGQEPEGVTAYIHGGYAPRVLSQRWPAPRSPKRISLESMTLHPLVLDKSIYEHRSHFYYH